MFYLSVFLAAIASFALGAVWYMRLAEQWMTAANIPRGPDGRPEGGQSVIVMAVTFVMQLLVAAMMRYVFLAADITGLFEGLFTGAGIGALFITPWIALNNANAGRPVMLTLIDGGSATRPPAVMGLVLALLVSPRARPGPSGLDPSTRPRH